ncbi:MAG: pyruvate dehydrogenase [Chloroflexi bacterium]|nr:pyruvate dehydrogenase [Chloroflexota bacterium]
MAVERLTHVDQHQDRDNLLKEIQDRALWLAMQMIHYANNVRPSTDDGKVGGHQASSASVATIMTSLFFDYMKAGDRISIKPHASPILHSIQYLLGNLDEAYLKTLRAFHGLQAYPSRTKDPDPVDFSTGSVGLGPVAPNFAALTEEYIRSHAFSTDNHPRRYISLVGDAELDEGSIWEAIAEPSMADMDNVLWVIDLNRQSLDRIIPGIRVRCWREMFGANGWNVIDAKYGKRLQAAFAEPNGELLRMSIDEMSNDMYQRLLRVSPESLREWLPNTSRYPKDLARFISRWDDLELQDLFRNLGGHDFATLREAFASADANSGPDVIFAYTLKGWMLPSIGDPQNHSVTLNHDQMEQLRSDVGVDEDDVWARLDTTTPAGRLCAEKGSQLGSRRRASPPPPDITIPADLQQRYSGALSTQQVYGLVLTDINRRLPEVSDRMVSVSPDVASSTNLGGWINKVGVWAREEREPMPEEGVVRALNWHESPQGQHIELGISENNLFMMLGQLGLSFEAMGELLFPIGTLYDPFVCRGLDAFTYSIYAGAKFIVVGTPSGITLSPEGGAHQSLVTPSIGVEMPDLAYYEPCFGPEVEWIMLDALEQIRRRTHSTYLRLSSKRIDQSLFKAPSQPDARERLRLQVLAGAYRLIDRRGSADYYPGENVVHIMANGAMVPEAIAASEMLMEEGILANVINVTGPGPLYDAFQKSVRAAINVGRDSDAFMSDVLPVSDRKAPIVTVADAHPHSLAWIGGALGCPVVPLGVSEFGQSGSREDLYREYGIDVDSIAAACFAALEV